MRFVVPAVLVLVASSSADAEPRNAETCTESPSHADEATSYCHIEDKRVVCEPDGPLMRFARGSSEITDSFSDMARLRATSGMPHVTFEVRGYAAYDEPGDQLALAKARGEALASFLVRHGLAKGRIVLLNPQLRTAMLGLSNIAWAAQVSVIGEGVIERPSDGVAIRMSAYLDEPVCVDRSGPLVCRSISYHVLFEENGVAPDPSSAPWMDRLAELAKMFPTAIFEIEASAGRDEPEPEALAAARAIELQTRLIAKGIRPERILVSPSTMDGVPAEDHSVIAGPVAIVRLKNDATKRSPRP